MLIEQRRQVVVHDRSRERARAFADLQSRVAGVIVGDLSGAAETRSIADQVNAIWQMDAAIHNAEWVYKKMNDSWRVIATHATPIR